MYKNLMLIAAICLMAACGGNKEREEELQKAKLDSLARPENVSIVSAIAKVEPEAGLIELSSSTGGNILEIRKQEGDTVKKGDVIILLDAEDEQLATEVLRKEIATQQAQAAADQAAARQYEAELREKEWDLSVSERLVQSGAETRQNVEMKRKDREVILANLQSARNKARASTGQIQTLRTQLSQSQVATRSKTIKAQQDGIITGMNARVGSSIQAFEAFATLAPEGPLVLDGEIDEMFANRVRLGQGVTLRYIGGKTVIGQGKVIYLSPVLSDKSILYETTAEAQDRRVREFKVEFTSDEPLLINHKVECTIQVKS